MPHRTPPPSAPSLPDELPFNTRAPDRMLKVVVLVALAIFFVLLSDMLTIPGQTPGRVVATRWMAMGAFVAAWLVATRTRGERGTLRMKRDVLVRTTESSQLEISYFDLRDQDLHARFPRRHFPGVTSSVYERFIQRIWARTALFKWIPSSTPALLEVTDKLVAHAETRNGNAALPFGVLVFGDSRTVVWGVEQACMNAPSPDQPIHHPTPTLFVTGYGLDTEDIVTSPRFALRHLHVVDLGITREDPFLTAAMASAHHGGGLSALAGSFSPKARLEALLDQEPLDHQGALPPPPYDRAAKLIELATRGRIPGARDDDAQATALASLFEAVPELVGFVGGWVSSTSALPFVAFGELAMLLRLRGAYGPIRYGADLAQRALWQIESSRALRIETCKRCCAPGSSRRTCALSGNRRRRTVWSRCSGNEAEVFSRRLPLTGARVVRSDSVGAVLRRLLCKPARSTLTLRTARGSGPLACARGSKPRMANAYQSRLSTAIRQVATQPRRHEPHCSPIRLVRS